MKSYFYVRNVRALAVLAILGIVLIFLNRHWVILAIRSFLPSSLRCSPAPKALPPPSPMAAMFTAEEMLYFTMGKGDPARHERRLVEYVRGRVARPSGHRAVLGGVPPVHVDTQGGKHYSEIGWSSPMLLRRKYI